MNINLGFFSKSILLFFLLFLSNTSHANNWVLSGSSSNEEVMYYVDYESARIINKQIEYWSVFNYNFPPTYQSQNYFSRVQKGLLDCGKREILTTYVILYSERFGKGSIVASVPPPSDNQWAPIPPNALANKSSEQLCKKFNLKY
jgi:hypothetical protein